MSSIWWYTNKPSNLGGINNIAKTPPPSFNFLSFLRPPPYFPYLTFLLVSSHAWTTKPIFFTAVVISHPFSSSDHCYKNCLVCNSWFGVVSWSVFTVVKSKHWAYGRAGNTKRGSITVPLTSYLTGLESAVRLLTIIVLICKTDLSKLVKQEINGTVILPPLVFPG